MPTIKDVAAEAGVTSTTVSRVLNNRGYISEETREKVYSAMEKLNYMPNEMARNLSRQKSDYIGVILPSVEHPYFSKVLHWLEHYVTKHNYKIMVCISENSREKELQYIDLLYSHRVLGIVVCSHIGETMEHLDSNCPLISFEREIAENIPEFFAITIRVVFWRLTGCLMPDAEISQFLTRLPRKISLHIAEKRHL